MAKALFSQYHKDSPGTLGVRLQKNYYNLIGCLCDCVETLTRQAETKDCNALYSSLCRHLVSEIREQMQYREITLIPYLNELEHKQQSGHNCLTCSGKCHVNHTGQLQQLKAAHQHIKEILYRIQQIATPMQQEIKYKKPACRTLINEVSQLDATLTELFYLEEAILIPKIMELQSQINAETDTSI